MTGLVLDASVALCWVFENQRDGYADRVEAAIVAGARPMVPLVWPLEVGQALARAERSRELGRDQVEARARFFAEPPFEVDRGGAGLGLSNVLTLARKYGLSTYDATYLELAARLGLPLATRDADMKRAARRLGVPLYA